MTVVRKLWGEFKAFAMSGNMLDLALGFIIGAAFAKLIESLADNVLMQLVAVVAGQPDFAELKININGGHIKYGQFLTDLVNFMMLAAVLFVIVKLIVRLGIGRGRVFGERQCPYCLDNVPPTALVCKSCGQQLVDELPPLADAERRLAESQTRRRLSLPNLPPLPRRAAAATGAAAGAASETTESAGAGEG